MTRIDWHPQKLIEEVERKSSHLTDLMAVSVLEDAQSEVPVDTGALQSSLAILSSSDKNALIGSELDYSVWVEYGTRHMQAQPYLRPALDSLGQKVDGMINQVSKD